ELKPRFDFIETLKTTLVQTVSSIESSCVTQLLPELNTNWENYVVYFFDPINVKRRESVEFPRKLEPHPSLRPRSVSINFTYGLTTEPYRLSNTLNVIITPLYYPNAWQVMDVTLIRLRNIVVASKSVFLFIWASFDESSPALALQLAKWADFMFIYPSLKFIVTIPKTLSCNRETSTATLVCYGFDTAALNYCTRVIPEYARMLEFGVWYEPFPLNVWIFVLIVIFYGMAYSFRHRFLRDGLMEFLNHVASILGQCPYVHTRYCVIILAIWFIICQLYGNGFMSIITVASKSQGLKTVKDLLENGYKLLNAGHNYSADDLLDGFLERNNLSEYADNAVTFVGAERTVEDLFKIMGKRGQKFAFKDTVSQNAFNSQLALKFLSDHFNESFNYFTIEERLGESQHNWVLKTENRGWLGESLQRLRSSGLYYKWDEWSTWHRLLLEGALFRKEFGDSDVVDKPKIIGWAASLIVPIFHTIFITRTHPGSSTKNGVAILSGIIGASEVVFCVEICGIIKQWMELEIRNIEGCSCGFLTYTSIESSCVTQLLPELNTNWGNYVIYFFDPINVKRRESVEFPRKLEPHPSLQPRSVSINSTYGLPAVPYRLSNTLNVIITPLYYPNAWQVMDFTLIRLRNIVVASKSVFLFIWASFDELTPVFTLQLAKWADFMFIYPSLKFIVTVPKTLSCNRESSTATLVCNGYCNPHPVPISRIGNYMLQNRLSLFNRIMFRKAQGKRISTVLRDKFSFIRYFLDNTNSEDKNCLSDLYRLNYVCTSEIMSIIVLGSIHNFTADMLQNTPRIYYLLLKQSFISGREVISFTSETRPEELSTTIISLYFPDRFDTTTLNYCTRVIPEYARMLEFGVWYEPFPLNVWIFVLIVIFYGMAYSFRHRFMRDGLMEFLNHVASILGQCPYVHTRYCVVILAIWFIICQLYGNGFTSIITVASKPQGLKTVKDLLENGYKLLNTGRNISADDLLDGFLEQNNLSEYADDAIKFVGGGTVEDLFKIMGKRGQRFAFKDTASENAFNSQLALKFLSDHFNESFNYFTIEERLGESQHNWVLKTENRGWLGESLQRLRSSGLYYKWDEWSTWHRLLLEGALFRNEFGDSDLVDKPKVAAILVILSLIIAVSIVVFCIETWERIENMASSFFLATKKCELMDIHSTIRYTYAVVEFPDEGSCDVIPRSWLTKSNTHCRYPKLPSFKITKTKANYAEYTSHVESETDNDRLWKSTKRVVPPPPTQSSSDDEIDVRVVQKRRRTTNNSAKRILFRDTHPFSEFSAPATSLIQTSSTERNQPSFRLAPGSGHLNSRRESPFHQSSVPNSPSTLQGA
ncbi:unnamed protein product, partial [Orchesella dallaii]